jgi:hypothetical protein
MSPPGHLHIGTFPVQPIASRRPARGTLSTRCQVRASSPACLATSAPSGRHGTDEAMTWRRVSVHIGSTSELYGLSQSGFTTARSRHTWSTQLSVSQDLEARERLREHTPSLCRIRRRLRISSSIERWEENVVIARYLMFCRIALIHLGRTLLRGIAP